MQKIEILRKDTYNCFQNIALSMAHYYNCDYRMMMLELWGFLYTKSGCGNIADRLALCWSGKLERRSNLLSKYHGFTFNYYKKTNVNNIVTFVNENIEKNPVGVYLDSYNCPWLPFYGKQHRGHIGMIIEQNICEYVVQDELCKDGEVYILDKAFVENGCEMVIAFKRVAEVQCSEDDYFHELAESVCTLGHTGAFTNYRDFIIDMRDFKITAEIPDTDDPVSSKLIMHLKNISDDRLNLVEAFEYIELQTGVDLEPAKYNLREIANKYAKLRAHIIKCCFSSKKADSNKCISELVQIFEHEKSVVTCVMERIKKRSSF